MRISDWSSDVCSSDLHDIAVPHHLYRGSRPGWPYGVGRALCRLHRTRPHHHGHDAEQFCKQQLLIAGGQNTGNACRLSDAADIRGRSEEHTSELQSLMRISYAVFCLKKKITNIEQQK